MHSGTTRTKASAREMVAFQARVCSCRYPVRRGCRGSSTLGGCSGRGRPPAGEAPWTRAGSSGLTTFGRSSPVSGDPTLISKRGARTRTRTWNLGIKRPTSRRPPGFTTVRLRLQDVAPDRSQCPPAAGQSAPVAVNIAVSPPRRDMSGRLAVALSVRAAGLALGAARGTRGQPRVGSPADELGGLVARNPAAARSRNGPTTVLHRQSSGSAFSKGRCSLGISQGLVGASPTRKSYTWRVCRERGGSAPRPGGT